MEEAPALTPQICAADRPPPPPDMNGRTTALSEQSVQSEEIKEKGDRVGRLKITSPKVTSVGCRLGSKHAPAIFPVL